MQVFLDPEIWTIIVGGFMGSTIYALNKAADLSWKKKGVLIFTGTVTSYYCAPLVGLWLSLVVSGFLSVIAKTTVTVTVPSGLAAFLCGYLAQRILAFALGWADKKKDETLNPPTP
ncbi:hypothetical protein [Fibrella forsythiae]|uniref:Phage holin family protein n=1 Tax=Fibrella forsythiae TaxID=2817061 RepID=A0ABS3JBW4_9BACT|nr:hypothetical protein [Fibrella forsythiae]MBO0947481.1 hypothetical protein [Fibrella forsythiae]